MVNWQQILLELETQRERVEATIGSIRRMIAADPVLARKVAAHQPTRVVRTRRARVVRTPYTFEGVARRRAQIETYLATAGGMACSDIARGVGIRANSVFNDLLVLEKAGRVERCDEGWRLTQEPATTTHGPNGAEAVQ